MKQYIGLWSKKGIQKIFYDNKTLSFDLKIKMIKQQEVKELGVNGESDEMEELS